MSRLLIEGATEVPEVAGLFQLGIPAILEPAPGVGNVRFPVARRVSGGAGPMPLEPYPSVSYQCMIKNDDVNMGMPFPHTFRYFLRGTGVPGASLELNAPGVPEPMPGDEGSPFLARSNAFGGFLLLPGQTLECEMQEALGDAPDAPIFAAQYMDVLDQALEVRGQKWGNQIGTFDDQNPLVVPGPPVGATFKRRIYLQPDSVAAHRLTDDLQCSSLIYNRDDADNDMTIEVIGANPAVVGRGTVQASQYFGNNYTGAVATHNGQYLSQVDLFAGDSLQVSLANAPNTTSPYGIIVFEDRI